MRIKSLCQNRIPGSVAQVCVMPICEPGEVCQDHIKMTINTGHTIHIMLIPIWVILTMFIKLFTSAFSAILSILDKIPLKPCRGADNDLSKFSKLSTRKRSHNYITFNPFVGIF